LPSNSSTHQRPGNGHGSKNSTDSESDPEPKDPPPNDIEPLPINHTRIASDSFCACTVNALAGLAWWFPINLLQATSSIQTIRLNGSTVYSMVPMQTSLNVNAAILSAEVVYTFATTYNTYFNTSLFGYVASTPPLPPAASTVVMTFSDVAPAPSTTFGMDQLIFLNIDMPTPTFAVPGATGDEYIA
jgi:hypothetical protein